MKLERLYNKAIPKVSNSVLLLQSSVTHIFAEQRMRLFSQIDFFVQMSGVEQKVQLSGKMPSVDEYRQRRMGTSAVTVCLAITE